MNSMAWLEPLASHFLREIQADLVNVAACSVGLNMHKSWLFATCFRPLQALASTCEHPRASVRISGAQGIPQAAFAVGSLLSIPTSWPSATRSKLGDFFPLHLLGAAFLWTRLLYSLGRRHRQSRLCQCKTALAFSLSLTGVCLRQTPKTSLPGFVPTCWTFCFAIGFQVVFVTCVTFNHQSHSFGLLKSALSVAFSSSGFSLFLGLGKSLGRWLTGNHTALRLCNLSLL